MKQIAARVPQEIDDEITEFSDVNDISKSEAIRVLLQRGLENDDLRNENERLQRSLQQLIEQRDEKKELVEYVEKERSLQERREERRDAPVWRRAKWWVFGKGNSQLSISD